jgi:hypothetical protein
VTADERELNAALDLDPGDAATRLVLSDLLESEGRLDEAEGQRWLVREGKWPTCGEGNNPDCPWDWWRKENIMANSAPRHAEAPDGLFSRLNHQCRYATRAEAEADLVAYARRAGLIAPASAEGSGGLLMSRIGGGA